LLSLSSRATVPATLLISCSASAAELNANKVDGQALGALNGQSAFVRGESGVLTEAVAAIGQWNVFQPSWNTVTEMTTLSLNAAVMAQGATAVTAEGRPGDRELR